MTAASHASDPHRLDHAGQPLTGMSADGPAPKRIVVAYGFWIFLLSDIIMFAAFFAGYAVLSGATAGGPSGRDLFDLRNAGIETVLLLLSSFTCGLASIAASVRNRPWFHVAMAATCLLGTGFLALELKEFVELIDRDIPRFALDTHLDRKISEAILYGVAQEVGEDLTDSGPVPSSFGVAGHFDCKNALRVSGAHLIRQQPSDERHIHFLSDHAQTGAKARAREIE